MLWWCVLSCSTYLKLKVWAVIVSMSLILKVSVEKSPPVESWCVVHQFCIFCSYHRYHRYCIILQKYHRSCNITAIIPTLQILQREHWWIEPRCRVCTRSSCFPSGFRWKLLLCPKIIYMMNNIFCPNKSIHNPHDYFAHKTYLYMMRSQVHNIS